MAYNSVINTEANRSSESDLSVLDSKGSIYDKGSGRNIGTPATRLDITAATTENIVSFIIAFILPALQYIKVRVAKKGHLDARVFFSWLLFAIIVVGAVMCTAQTIWRLFIL